MNKVNERKKIVEELINTFGIVADGKTRPLATFERIADFILADRKRIVQPLVEYRKEHGDASCGVKLGFTFSVFNSIDETIKLAGVNDE